MAETKRRGARAQASPPTLSVQRVQTGLRLEKSILRVLRALAAYHDLSLGDLLEGIVLHAFEGKPAFGPEGLARIGELNRIYGMRLDASHSHRLVEPNGPLDDDALPERRTPARASATRKPNAARRP